MPTPASHAFPPAVRFAFLLTFLCIVRVDARPLLFEQNLGQSAAEVKFLARGDGYALFLTQSSAVMKLHPQGEESSATVTMKLIGAAEDAAPRGERRAAMRTSYFVGNDPAQWRTDVPAYHAVRYPRVYRGIDLVYYGADGEAEYDFELQPGADPRSIRLAFEGARAISISEEGELILRTRNGDVRQQRPFAYQLVRGEKKRVAADYVVRNGTEVAFRIGRYDRRVPLVIDPVVRYATYLGGNAEETPLSVAVDGEGNTYVAGCTHSPDFPGAPGGRLGGADVFVSKIDRTGANIIYTAFLGGSGWECAGGIAVERDGSAHITGYTGSFEFPVRNAAQPTAAGSLDAFVATLEPSGAALRYSTFLGGSDFENNPEVGPVGNVTIGADGATYVTGHTRSADFPLTPNAVQRQYGDGIDAFVARIDTSLSGPVSLQYSTFLGGAAIDTGAAVTVDDLRAIYVTGVTYSPDFPVTAAAFRPHYSGEGDAFVTKIATAGNALAWSTFAGGESLDHGEDIVVDAQGRVYLAAYVTSINYPTVQPLQTAHGGFFKSNDGARTWNKRNSGLGTSLIKSIVFDPKRPNRVYAGTWRGMYRSDDGGETWRAVNAGLPINAGGTLNVSDVAIDSDGVQLFAATWRGLYRSVDGGETWQPRDNGLSRTNEGYVFAIAVEVDPKTPSTVYAASVAPAGGVVFKSIDSGATWTAIDGATPRGLIPLFGQALAVDPKQTSTVYAGSFGSVYRTDDAGATWRELRNGLPNTSVYQIVVDPENPATVYVATITEVYKSSDRGETWRRASDGIGDGIVSGLVIDPQNPSILYLNKGGNSVGRIASTSTSSIAAGTDRVNGGIFKTTDGGQTWTAVNEGLESNGGGGIAIQPGNSSVIVAGEMVTVDIGLTRFSADGSSAEWSTYFGGRDRDMPAGMVLACGDRLFIGGSTMSDDYPLVRPTQNQRRGHLFHDAFVTELSFSAAAPEVKFSTFAGSPDEEEDTRDLAADCQGNVYLTGRTYSRNFPTIAALQPYHAGGMLDGFLMKISVDGEKGPTTRRRSVRQ